MERREKLDGKLRATNRERERERERELERDRDREREREPETDREARVSLAVMGSCRQENPHRNQTGSEMTYDGVFLELHSLHHCCVLPFCSFERALQLVSFPRRSVWSNQTPRLAVFPPVRQTLLVPCPIVDLIPVSSSSRERG